MPEWFQLFKSKDFDFGERYSGGRDTDLLKSTTEARVEHRGNFPNGTYDKYCLIKFKNLY